MKTTVRTGLPEVEWASVFNQENEIFNDIVWRDDGGNMRIKITPRRPSDTEIKQAKRRRKITVTAYEGAPSGDKAPPENLLKFEKWVRKVIDKIPAGNERKSASIKFDSDYDGDMTIRVTWQRPETDEEWVARKNDIAQRLKAWQDHVEQERLARNQKIATALGGVAI